MNTVKKIITVITVIFVVIRLFMISVSASFAAPIMAEETLKTALIEGIIAGGSDYTKDDLESWDLDDLENEFQIQVNTNSDFNSKNSIESLVNSSIDFQMQCNEVIINWLDKMVETGGNIYDFINPTYNSSYIDIPSSGAVIEITDALDQHRIIYLNDYGLKVLTSDGRAGFTIRQNIVARQVIYDKHGKLLSDKSYDTPNNAQATYTLNSASIKSIQIYGDWRYDEDTPAETDDEAVPVIGEVAGTQVTPDMLNPDGTVTIDGTTYSPSDYIDWDKFKDNAIIDLLNDILKELENVPVIDDSKTDIDEIDSDVDLPSELSDFAIPGLIDVFPFCLPKHFIRGMYLFSTEPEVPHFETEIKIPAFLNVPEQNWKIEIDFKEFEPLAKITRWCSLISFIYCLILLTPKIAKGA